LNGGAPGTAAAGPRIDWGRPWLRPYRDPGEALEADWRAGRPVAEALNGSDDSLGAQANVALPLCLNPLGGRAGQARPWGHSEAATAEPPRPGPRFAPPSCLPEGEAYEAFIHRTGRVPTRDNLHDLFNGLVWRRFPRIKRRLNELQAAEIQAQGVVGGRRGAVRDALTLFDENAALLQAPEALVSALRRRDWQALFDTHRALWRQATLTLFGHALLEKLALQPRKAITAHVWLLPPGADLQALALPTLAPEALAGKPFLPLPVLGVPGWWPANEQPGFYDDASVFRPAAAAPAPPG
jgi:hypothetical protein